MVTTKENKKLWTKKSKVCLMKIQLKLNQELAEQLIGEKNVSSIACNVKKSIAA